MVDKAKRLVAANLIEEFASCRITNFKFRDRFPHSEDRALHAIYSMLWFVYDDLHEHRLKGKQALTDEARGIFERCVLFLQTDIEYGGPANFVSLTAPFKRVWMRIVGRKERPQPLSPVWPFDSSEQLEQARHTNSKI